MELPSRSASLFSRRYAFTLRVDDAAGQLLCVFVGLSADPQADLQWLRTQAKEHPRNKNMLFEAMRQSGSTTSLEVDTAASDSFKHGWSADKDFIWFAETAEHCHGLERVVRQTWPRKRRAKSNAEPFWVRAAERAK